MYLKSVKYFNQLMEAWCLALWKVFVNHVYILCISQPSKKKSVRLIRLLEEIMSEKENKTIIFVETKRRCDELTRRMRRDG